MSARQPFVPQQRPPSRPNPAVEKTADVKTALDDSLRPNGLLPVGTDPQLPARPPSRDKDNMQDMLSINNKPLNISGFMKNAKKAHPVSLPGFGKPRRSFEDVNTRAASPKHPQQTMRLSVSSPFFASNNGFVPSRRSSASTSSTSPLQSSGDDLSSNQAHIPTKPPGLEGVNRMDYVSQPQIGVHHRSRSSSRPSLEKIHETAEEEDAAEPYALHSAAQDSLNHYHSSSSPIPDEQHETSRAYDQFSAQTDGHEKSPLRRVQKRFNRPEDLDETSNFGNTAKKYKMDDEQGQQMFYVSRTSPMQYHEEVQEVQHFRDEQVEIIAPSPIRHGSSSAFPQPESQQGPAQEEHVLRRLLGQDLDTYVNAHVDAYDERKKKWTECSIDEWKAGADELADRYTKLLDFVKEHMVAKITLYKDLHGTIQARSDSLSQREEALKVAREALMRDGASVVSGGAVFAATSASQDN